MFCFIFTVPHLDSDSDTDLDSDSKPDGYIVLYRNCSIIWTQTQIPTPYFCTGQESESMSVPESISGNVRVYPHRASVSASVAVSAVTFENQFQTHSQVFQCIPMEVANVAADAWCGLRLCTIVSRKGVKFVCDNIFATHAFYTNHIQYWRIKWPH